MTLNCYIIKSPMINTVECVVCQHKTYLLCCSQTQVPLTGLCQACLLACHLTGDQTCNQCHKSVSPQILSMKQERKRFGGANVHSKNQQPFVSNQPSNPQSSRPSQHQGPIKSIFGVLKPSKENMVKNIFSLEANSLDPNLSSNKEQIYGKGRKAEDTPANNNWPVYISSEQPPNYVPKYEGFSAEDMKLLSQVVDLPLDTSYEIARERVRSGVTMGKIRESASTDEVYTEDDLSQFTTIEKMQNDFDY